MTTSGEKLISRFGKAYFPKLTFKMTNPQAMKLSGVITNIFSKKKRWDAEHLHWEWNDPGRMYHPMEKENLMEKWYDMIIKKLKKAGISGLDERKYEEYNHAPTKSECRALEELLTRLKKKWDMKMIPRLQAKKTPAKKTPAKKAPKANMKATAKSIIKIKATTIATRAAKAAKARKKAINDRAHAKVMCKRKYETCKKGVK